VRNRQAVQAAMAAEGLIEHRWRAA